MSGKNPEHYRRETRAQWGGRQPRARRYVPRDQRVGVAVHYPGGGRYAGQSHDRCRELVRIWQGMHMARGSNDLEYGAVLCQHLVLMEARTELNRPGVRVGSNGTAAANDGHTSVQLLRGADDGPPTDRELLALAEYITWLRAKGWGPAITGHRDHVPTACPGDPLYRDLGDIRRLVSELENPKPPEPKPDWPYVQVRRLRRVARRAEWATALRRMDARQVALVTEALAARECKDYQAWQEHLGYEGPDADGVPGVDSLGKLFKDAGVTVIDNT